MSNADTCILILDDDVDVACAAQLMLRKQFGQICVMHSPADLPGFLDQRTPDLVLLDFNFTPGKIDGSEGLAVLDTLRALPRPPEVIAMTAYADVPLAVAALKLGACDFVTKPWDNTKLLATIQGALARRIVRIPPGDSNPDDGLMGNTAAIHNIRSMIASVGPTDANVMIIGENGSGKELVARAVHKASRRAAEIFLAVDMGALPESTFESEMFGHRKGAFTDARSDRAGRFQTARKGSLFLDEIGNMPLTNQAKLLAALERREITAVGADRPEALDVRIISATNLNEVSLFNPALFRTDLLFRLNTIVIRVPPLRERREDIPTLLHHYLHLYQQQYQRPALDIAEETLHALSCYEWPGNIRALRHACERAVILRRNETTYQLEDFGLTSKAPVTPTTPPVANTVQFPKSGQQEAEDTNLASEELRLAALERTAIATAMDQVDGNISHAAKLLGVSRAALYRKLSKHGI